MLQQTQVDRVIPKYRTFLRRFPTVRVLARATPRDVLLVWAGMGYNRRALYLHRMAREVVSRSNGRVPTDPASLRALPGVGEYTAAAVATFTTGVPHALSDTNVRRVMRRVFLGADQLQHRELEWKLRRVIEEATPTERVGGLPPALWGHAVMDLGALVCRAKPRCEICPLTRWCKAYPALQLETRNKEHGTRRRRRSRCRVPSSKLARPLLAAVPDRLLRGRILRLTREADPQPVRLASLVTGVPERSAAAVRALVRGMVGEGLLAWRGCSVVLPVTGS